MVDHLMDIGCAENGEPFNVAEDIPAEQSRSSPSCGAVFFMRLKNERELQ